VIILNLLEADGWVGSGLRDEWTDLRIPNSRVEPMLQYRVALILAISIGILLISIIFDKILAPLPLVAHFLIFIPAIVLIVDEARQYTKENADMYKLRAADVDGAFFFAAPLAALAASSLFTKMRVLLGA